MAANSSKGQSTLEYLMNYSWAFLILAIVLAAILATGAFNPNYYVMEECYLGASFRCLSALVEGPSGSFSLSINITNTLGYPVKLKTINLAVSEDDGSTVFKSYDFTNTTLANTYSYLTEPPIALALYPVSPGTVKKISMNLSYYICAEEVNPGCNPDSSTLRTVSGRIITQVLQAQTNSTSNP